MDDTTIALINKISEPDKPRVSTRWKRAEAALRKMERDKRLEAKGMQIVKLFGLKVDEEFSWLYWTTEGRKSPEAILKAVTDIIKGKTS